MIQRYFFSWGGFCFSAQTRVPAHGCAGRAGHLPPQQEAPLNTGTHAHNACRAHSVGWDQRYRWSLERSRWSLERQQTAGDRKPCPGSRCEAEAVRPCANSEKSCRERMQSYTRSAHIAELHLTGRYMPRPAAF